MLFLFGLFHTIDIICVGFTLNRFSFQQFSKGMTKKEQKEDGVGTPSGKQKPSALTISQINADKLTLVS